MPFVFDQQMLMRSALPLGRTFELQGIGRLVPPESQGCPSFQLHLSPARRRRKQRRPSPWHKLAGCIHKIFASSIALLPSYAWSARGPFPARAGARRRAGAKRTSKKFSKKTVFATFVGRTLVPGGHSLMVALLWRLPALRKFHS